ncbi:hypothetical protein V6N12_055027 [Hibiscus sabdariffa]|uniref:Uncharacterized protein n=1 Tax=Hibiscus sabdariffa TaxID=183260 RepID=A0ABR2D268_9ROSI
MVGAKDSLNVGDRIFLPISVREFPEEKQEHHCTNEDSNFIRSLELYKGGIGIKWSLDELAATWLCYDYSEPPRLGVSDVANSFGDVSVQAEVVSDSIKNAVDSIVQEGVVTESDQGDQRDVCDTVQSCLCSVDVMGNGLIGVSLDVVQTEPLFRLGTKVVSAGNGQASSSKCPVLGSPNSFGALSPEVEDIEKDLMVDPTAGNIERERFAARQKANTIIVPHDDQGQKLDIYEGISNELVQFFLYSLDKIDSDVDLAPDVLL